MHDTVRTSTQLLKKLKVATGYTPYISTHRDRRALITGSTQMNIIIIIIVIIIIIIIYIQELPCIDIFFRRVRASSPASPTPLRREGGRYGRWERGGVQAVCRERDAGAGGLCGGD